jgi:nucleoside-diphosphate-sugar epimerase
VRPDDPTCPDDEYGASKLKAEQLIFDLVRGASMTLTVIRPPLVYGPGVKGNFDAMMRAVHSGMPLPFGAITDNRRSMISVINLVDFICCVLDHPAATNEVFLVSDGQDLSTKGLLGMIAVAMGKNPRLIAIPPSYLSVVAKLLGRAKLMDRLTGSLSADISKTKTLLAWSPPVATADGIQQAVEDFMSRL